MPAPKNYQIFISHAWKYNMPYYKLVEILNAAPAFQWTNLSVPEHDPLHVSTNEELEQQLREQIDAADVVLIISGMYVDFREWIQMEMHYALAREKPIIGIKPGGNVRFPAEVQAVAKVMVAWDEAEIVEAIRRYAL